MDTSSPSLLLTGASGRLGEALQQEAVSPLLTPGRETLDLCHAESITNYFTNHPIRTIIHCAAIARVTECETNPLAAHQTNLLGTSLLIEAVLKQEAMRQQSIRFVHISTDGVYPGTDGNYSENAPVLPYNKYGWSKLGAECAVQMLSNFCIIRGRFFDPHHLTFETAANDLYSSRLPLQDFAHAVWSMVSHPFVGILNIGGNRKSDYECYAPEKPSIRPCSHKELSQLRARSPLNLAKDVSLDLSQWQALQEEE